MSKKIIKYLIMFLLLIFWIGGIGYAIIKTDPTVINQNFGVENISDFNTNEIIKGDTITGFFKADANNLGIISVRFINFNRDNDDFLIFKIKQKNQNNWYYQNLYKVDQFQNNQLFTFGFPIIKNSKNKDIEFELVSTKGRVGDAVGLSRQYPVFVAKYKFTKQEIITGRNNLTEFIKLKISNLLFDPSFIGQSFVYFLPLLFYLLWLYVFPEKTYIFSVNPFVAIFTLVTLVISLLLPDLQFIIQIIYFLIWLFLIKIYSLTPADTYAVALVYLCFCPFLVYFNFRVPAQNIAELGYYFLIFATVFAFLKFKSAVGKMEKKKKK